MSDKQQQDTGCSSNCNCGGGIPRRNFMKIAGAGSVALLASHLPIMAGPFSYEDFKKLIPSDKKLAPDWVRSLYARGKPERCSGQELKYIGMQVIGSYRSAWFPGHILDHLLGIGHVPPNLYEDSGADLPTVHLGWHARWYAIMHACRRQHD